MRSAIKIICLFVVLLTPAYVSAAWSVVDHTCASVSDGGDGSTPLTSGSINTTGASLLIAYSGVYIGTSNPAFSDSKSNTWTGLTNIADSQNSRLWYAYNATVGSGHTFTISGDSDLFNQAFCVIALSGALTSNPFDIQNTNSNSLQSTIAPGSITPSQDNEIIVTGFASGAQNTTPAIGSSFTLADSTIGSGHGVIGIAYLTQMSSSAVNPTWTGEPANNNQASIASFKAATTSRRQVAPVIFR